MAHVAVGDGLWVRRHVLAPPAQVGNAHALRGLRPLAWLSGAVLLVQLALGGWTSTNYATLACSD